MSYPKANTSSTLNILSDHEEEYMQYESEEKLTWCTGCGNFGIQNALRRALTLEGYGIRDVLFCFDVGCNGNGSDKIHGYTFHGLHGRVISAAAGAALANPNMKVVASAGDGASLSEGINHLVHGVRNNYPMLFILHNNENYGLTTGQPSATTRCGQSMNAAPNGVPVDPISPLQLIMSCNPTFVARTFSGEVEHMTEMLRLGLRHNGFAVVEVMQICSTYNHATSHEWFWDRIRWVDEDKKYRRQDLWQARKAVEDVEKTISMGWLYERPDVPNFYETFEQRKKLKTTATDEVKHYDISKLLKSFQ